MSLNFKLKFHDAECLTKKSYIEGLARQRAYGGAPVRFAHRVAVLCHLLTHLIVVIAVLDEMGDDLGGVVVALVHDETNHITLGMRHGCCGCRRGCRVQYGSKCFQVCVYSLSDYADARSIT